VFAGVALLLGVICLLVWYRIMNLYKIYEICGFWDFQKGGLVGAFCAFGVSDTGSPVHFLRIFGFLG